jgi:branched-chain amino acid transport system permease protein
MLLKMKTGLFVAVKNVAGLPRPVPYEVDMQKSEWLQNIVAWIIVQT